MKVLHIVENFNGQATEKWLLQAFEVLQEDGCQLDWDFFCTLDNSGKFSNKLIGKGAKVFCSPKSVSKLIPFMRLLRRTVRNGSYDILHCHQDLMSAIYLLATIGLPVRKRIVHIHNTSLSLPTHNRLKIFIFKRLFKLLCTLLSDHIIGVSEEALEAFHKEGKSNRLSVIHCGIDLLPYQENKISYSEFRENLGIPSDSIIMLFVGRMIEYKNPCFVLDILEQMPPNYHHVYAIFAGAGPLEEKVRRIADEKELSKRIRVLGWQDNIPSIMQSCDLLVWPGLEETMEGLGLGVVEAQTAGLKVVMSLNVPKDAIVIPELVDVVSLAAGPKVWADTIVVAVERSGPDKHESLQRVSNSSFSILESAVNIQRLYRT